MTELEEYKKCLNELLEEELIDITYYEHQLDQFIPRWTNWNPCWRLEGETTETIPF